MSPSVLEHLYPEALYLLPSRTVIVIDREWDQLADEEKSLLTKILASVKLTLPAVHIVTRHACDPEQLGPLNPSRIISFGPPPAIPVTRYQNNDTNGVSLICADSLKDLDDARKKNLWLALRQMFTV